MNIYELAKVAGFSISTTSKALNGRHDVNEETRMRIRALAERHGYHPSRMARGLANNATENIGIIALRRGGFSVMTNPFYSRVLEGMETEVSAGDYNLLLSVIAYEENRPLPMPKKIREKNVDGLILMGWMPEALLADFSKRKIPCVFLDQSAPKFQGYSIMLDNAGGIAKAVRRLFDAGHRRAALICGQINDTSFAERREGFLKATQELGMHSEELLAKEGSALSPAAMRTWLQGEDRAKAAVCVNDDHALKLMAEAVSLGLKIPGDLAVTGFDDIEYSATSQPPLSTLRVDKQALGAKAVQTLIRMIKEGAPRTGTERLPVEWVERGSI